MTGLARSQAFSGHLKPGKHPALLIVDMVEAYLQPDSPLYLETAAAALEATGKLIKLARTASIPVIYTNVCYRPDGSDGGLFFRKVPALSVFVEGSALGAFPAEIAPQPEEPVFTKQYPSAFFNTGVDAYFQSRSVDTVVIAGYSTSGCVRASALDALQHGYIPIIATDACADRDEEVHMSNLADLSNKYSELQEVSQIREWLK